MSQDVKPIAYSSHACSHSTNGVTRGGRTCPELNFWFFGGLVGASCSSKQVSPKRRNISSSLHEAAYQETLVLPTSTRLLLFSNREKDPSTLRAPYRYSASYLSGVKTCQPITDYQKERKGRSTFLSVDIQTISFHLVGWISYAA